MFKWFTAPKVQLPDPAWAAGPMGMMITGQDGFLCGTHVVSNLGWRRVDALCVGDKVLTFDNGMRTIVEIQRETLTRPAEGMPRSRWPMMVPEGALLNRRAMSIMPDQGVFIESDLVVDALGDPYAIVPARALDGYRGIEPANPHTELTLTTLAFAQDEVVYAEGGMLAYCPCARELLDAGAEDDAHTYQVLSLQEARTLIQQMASGPEATPLGWHAEEISAVQKSRPGRPMVHPF
ncbi:Hint domain-containing protein [Aliisedimentitalea scapharcae]|uniref:Hint domain-containing protein n=1 Tax=Aliisedimentitalea scapharcae TaxID=1524259 RepID=A0ABZ2XQJ7_9RHOB